MVNDHFPAQVFVINNLLASNIAKNVANVELICSKFNNQYILISTPYVLANFITKFLR